MELKIISRAGDEISLGNMFPPAFHQYKLIGSAPVVAASGFGNILMQHFAGNGFSIWYSIYRIETPVTLIGRADQAVLELHIPIRNNVSYNWDGLGFEQLQQYQFDVSFTPFVNTRADFQQTGEYHTFDIHYQKETLQAFAPYFPALNEFLYKVEKGQPANLLNVVKFLSPDMIRVINEMLQYQFIDALAPAFYESKTMELLILMLQHISTKKDIPSTALLPMAVEHAKAAKDMISANLEYQYTASELAKILGTNIYMLKTTFRQLYGTSLFKFGLQSRMEFAQQLLLANNFNISEIAWLVGYPDVQNFSIAFKRHFKISPGQVKIKS